MKKIPLLAFFLLITLGAFAQMGKTKAELLAKYGKSRVVKESEGRPGYSGILFRVDSTLFLQATFKADVAVMLSYVHTDSQLSEQQYIAYVSRNMPGFSPRQKCILGSKTYLLDASKNYLVVQNHREGDDAFPIVGLIMVTDPAIISSMAGKIREFCQ